LIAVDDEGQLLWKLQFRNVLPLALDRSGRLYLSWYSQILCLAD
jgi:hypothetical protein